MKSECKKQKKGLRDMIKENKKTQRWRLIETGNEKERFPDAEEVLSNLLLECKTTYVGQTPMIETTHIFL